MALESRNTTATTESNDEEQDSTPDPRDRNESPDETPAETSGETPDETPAGTSADKPAEATGTGSSDDPAGPRTTGGFAAGAAAVVSAGLALISLTGTGLADMMRSRQEIIGQIEASLGRGDQIDALYGAPWETAALLNGIFGLLAIVAGGVLLVAHAGRSGTQSWVKSVALGGVVLGVLGTLVAGGMYFDLFAAQPVLPQAPSPVG